MNQNRELAGATLAHLSALGVHHVIVCAGARNAPLVTSLLHAAPEGRWRIHPHFDERSAAFFALGISKKSREAVAVVTTSGTAVAELLPATIEAYYSGLPLILVTADRPANYRGSGAPQAIEQVDIFGIYAPVAIDAQVPDDLEEVGTWSRAEPLHLNLCFDEPRPDEAVESLPAVPVDDPRKESEAEGGEALLEFVGKARNLVVLLGELDLAWRGDVEKFLVDLGVPVWGEATSGLRESSKLSGQLVRQERCLSDLEIGAVLRIGGVPSLRFWRDLESREDIDVLSVTRRPFSGLARESRLILTPSFPVPSGGAQQGSVMDPTLLRRSRLEDLIRSFPRSEPALFRELSERIPPDAMVFLGNSLPIREWNMAASVENPHPRCFASRGANGIDGQVATFLGLSEGEEESWGVFGDLTALYDLNAPALMKSISPGLRRIVIINNGGGRIFSRLPSMAGLSEDKKEVTENRHDHTFESWAAMWGMAYVSWSGEEGFPEVRGESVVLEISPSLEETESFWNEWK